MRMPWTKSKAVQLELLDEAATPSSAICTEGQLRRAPVPRATAKESRNLRMGPRQDGGASAQGGQPLLVPVSRLHEDPGNPRTVFPEAELEELADDILHRGILQPLVVHPADGEGRHRIHFGAKRLRAAIRAGLHEVPVVVRDVPTDRYAQVAENQKRHGLTPLELARFVRAQVDAGDSNVTIARQLGMNLTAIAHHLALLELPPVLDDVLKSGRCTSPRTLHELCKLHVHRPDEVQALLSSGAEITRSAVATLRAEPFGGVPAGAGPSPTDKLIARAHAACGRLERALGRIQPSDLGTAAQPELAGLRDRVQAITTRWLQGSDRQTPSQPDR
jgi:ParB family chromosome partitioning protein